MGGGGSTMHLIEEPSDTLGGLYICGVDALFDAERLHKHGIKSILNMAEESMYGRTHNETDQELREILAPFTVKVVGAEDDEGIETDLRPLFPEVANWVNQQLAVGGVVVHCRRGVNRSCSGLISYLMIQRKLFLNDAFRKVRRVRGKVCPIALFWKYLRELEQNLLTAGVRLQRDPSIAPQQPPELMAGDAVDAKGEAPQDALLTDDLIQQLDREVHNLQVSESILAVFKKFTPESAGQVKVSKAELANVMEFIDPGKWTPESTDCLLEAVDTNQDGCVDVGEYTAWVLGDSKEQKEIYEALVARYAQATAVAWEGIDVGSRRRDRASAAEMRRRSASPHRAASPSPGRAATARHTAKAKAKGRRPAR